MNRRNVNIRTLYSMTYKSLWVINCQLNPCRGTVMELFNPQLGDRGFYNILWHSRLGLQSKLTASRQRGNILPTSVLDMTLNNLMVRQ